MNITETRMRELAEKFASAIVEQLQYEDVEEIIAELDMTPEEVEYFGWEGHIELEEDDDDYEDLLDDYDYASNMPCDTYGMCSGSTCPKYFECHGGR